MAYKDKATQQEASRKYHIAHKAARNAYAIQYYADHKEEISNQRRRHYAEHKVAIAAERKSVKGRFRIYRLEAPRRNLTFSLTLEQFDYFTSQPCLYCGKWSDDERRIVGIDRFDNNEGYYVDNVLPCCAICNSMRGALTVKKFVLHCARISWRMLNTLDPNTADFQEFLERKLYEFVQRTIECRKGAPNPLIM